MATPNRFIMRELASVLLGETLQPNTAEEEEKLALKKLSSLFTLETTDVRDVLNFKDRMSIEKKAFLGDALLTYRIRAYLIEKYPDKGVGFITEAAKFYLSNKVMKNFLLDHLDAPYKQNVEQMSTHNAGTVFECLLNLSFSVAVLSGSKFMNYFIEYINKKFPKTVFLALMEAGAFESTDTEDDQLSKRLRESLEREMHPVLKINPMIPPARMKEAVLISEAIQKGGEYCHQGEKICVEWRSRSKNYYESFFYSCCGTSVEEFGCDFRKQCPRSLWMNQNTYHCGTLTGISSGKYGGGMNPTGRSYDHIPRSQLPIWSCCRKYSNAEGCKPLLLD